MMTNDEIREVLEQYPRQYAKKLEQLHPEAYHFINDQEFPILNGYKFATKLYWHLNGLTDFPTYVCPVCGKKERLERNVFSIVDGYARWMNRTGCCYKCSQDNPATREKKCETNLQRFGVENNSQIEGHAERCKAARDRMSKERRELVQERRKNTCLRRFGAEHFSQTKEYREKVAATNMENFGVPFASQSEEVKSRMANTFLSKYGVDNPLKLDSVREKVKKTCQERYNVEWFQQSELFQQRKRHKFRSKLFPGPTFDSNWEVMVYEFCKLNGIQMEYSPKVKFEYEYNGVKHFYHPDFLINGKVYEVKGDNFFRTNESTGKEEMFCPYRRPEWSDEKYEYICGIYEAKHQCMLKNNVIILRGREIGNLKEVFNNGYT